MPVVVNEQLVSESLCIDHKAGGTIRSESNNLANDPLASNLDGREMSLRLKSACSSRDQCGDGASNKSASVNRGIHRIRRLRRFTHLRNLRNLWDMSSFPEWLVPMAATLTQDRFTGPDWIFERKFDGIRLLAYKKGSDVQLFSRNQLPQHLPAIQQAIERLPHEELILDGEITWRGGKVAYHVFDIMWIDGRNVTTIPLEERRDLLAQLPFRDPIHRVALIDDPSPWELAQKEGWEGVIAKRRGSVYEHRRSKQWLKMKCELSQNFLVGGFTDPQGKRVGLGALLVGYFKDDDFVLLERLEPDSTRSCCWICVHNSTSWRSRNRRSHVLLDCRACEHIGSSRRSR